MSSVNHIKQFGLIGYPLVHSFSKGYFNAKFQEWGRTDCRYDNFSIATIDEIRGVLESHTDLVGLNVTIPYKEAVIPFLDELDDVAKAVGAVNCIHIRNGKTKGYNTVVFGFEMSIKPFLENRSDVVSSTAAGNSGAKRESTP